MIRTSLHAKNTGNKLSEQVQNILSEKGFSFLFNWSDYKYFEKQAANAWNKAQEIADLFIQDASDLQSDLSEYLF